LKHQLKVVSSNIRFDNPKDGDHRWGNRKDILKECIEDFSPDLLSTQEGYRPQLESLNECLPHLSLISSHRDWIKERMYPSLFYNEKTLEVESSGDIWLSETPNVPGSKSFKSAFPRLCSWASLKFKSNQKRLFLANCHLDHILRETRTEQVRVLAEEIEKIRTKNEALILTGDFNDDPTSSVRKIIEGLCPVLYDPWCKLGLAEESSHHSFNGTNPEGSRIDWIMVDERLNAAEIFLDKREKNGIYPSDHFPLKAKFLF